MISSKRYSTTGKVKPGICIIGQLPIMVDKNIIMTLYSMFKIKINTLQLRKHNILNPRNNSALHLLFPLNLKKKKKKI